MSIDSHDWTVPASRISKLQQIDPTRHCEKRSDEAIQSVVRGSGLLRFVRNDRYCAPGEDPEFWQL